METETMMMHFSSSERIVIKTHCVDNHVSFSQSPNQTDSHCSDLQHQIRIHQLGVLLQHFLLHPNPPACTRRLSFAHGDQR